MTAKKEKETTKKQASDAPQEEEKKKVHDNRGKFAKGHMKVGGRKRGTPNKAGNIRDRLKEQVEPFVNTIGEKLLLVEKQEGTKEMLTLLEKFMPYFMPKYSALSIGADQEPPMDEEQALLELDAKYTKKELSINFKSMIVVDNDKLRDDSDPDDDPDFDLSQLKASIEE